MAPRNKAAAAKATSKSSKAAAASSQDRRSSRIKKPASKTQLHARVEAGSGASSRQASKNASRRGRSPRPRPSSTRIASPASEGSEEDDDDEEDEEAPSDEEVIALRQREKAIAKEVRIQRQRSAARSAFAAQELQLKNLTVDDTRMSVSHILAVDAHASAGATATLEDRSSSVGALPNFGAVATMFPSVSRRYLEDIFHGRLDVKNIIRFIVDFSFIIVSEKIDASEAKSMVDLSRSFDMYAYIV